MSNIQQAIELLSMEKATLENRIKVVDSAIHLLSSRDVIPAIKSEEVPAVHVQDDDDPKIRFAGYPIDGKQRDKVRFILSRHDKAISEPEFENIIRLMEGQNAKATMDVFQRTLRGMTHPKFGEVLQFKFEGDKTRFYIVPNWRTDDKTQVIREKLPIPNNLNMLNPEVLVNPVFIFKKVE